jgi:predicted nucleic acid-binding protein
MPNLSWKDVPDELAERLRQRAARYELSASDAAYLWLAAELQAPLATFDQKLAAAAQGVAPTPSDFRDIDRRRSSGPNW